VAQPVARRGQVRHREERGREGPRRREDRLDGGREGRDPQPLGDVDAGERLRMVDDRLGALGRQPKSRPGPWRIMGPSSRHARSAARGERSAAWVLRGPHERGEVRLEGRVLQPVPGGRTGEAPTRGEAHLVPRARKPAPSARKGCTSPRVPSVRISMRTVVSPVVASRRASPDRHGNRRKNQAIPSRASSPWPSAASPAASGRGFSFLHKRPRLTLKPHKVHPHSSLPKACFLLGIPVSSTWLEAIPQGGPLLGRRTTLSASRQIRLVDLLRFLR
jgi:hypothetical protein